MILFFATISVYSLSLLFLRPAPESLKAQPLNFVENFLAVRSTLFAGLLLCLIFLLASGFGFTRIQDDVVVRYGLSNESSLSFLTGVQAVTHLFLHHDVFHLLANLSSLGLIGSLYERRVGPKKFLAVFSVAAVFSICSIFFYTEPTFVFGISGSVFGVAAAYFLDFKQLSMKEYATSLAVFLVLAGLYSFVPSHGKNFGTDIKIDHIGHFFGALGTIIFLRFKRS